MHKRGNGLSEHMLNRDLVHALGMSGEHLQQIGLAKAVMKQANLVIQHQQAQKIA